MPVAFIFCFFTKKNEFSFTITIGHDKNVWLTLSVFRDNIKTRPLRKTRLQRKIIGGKRIPRYKKQNYLGSQCCSMIKYSAYDSNIRRRFYLMRIFSCRFLFIIQKRAFR